jgi:hypothetical protein
MEKFFIPVPINYLIILLVEVSVFSIFVYFVFSKTKDEVCRRWKASVFIGVIPGILIQIFIFGLLAVGWLTRVNSATIIDSFIKGLHTLIPYLIVIEAFIFMPFIICNTFFAYFHFLINGDHLIDKFWRNQKIQYGQSQKSSFLKF